MEYNVEIEHDLKQTTYAKKDVASLLTEQVFDQHQKEVMVKVLNAMLHANFKALKQLAPVMAEKFLRDELENIEIYKEAQEELVEKLQDLQEEIKDQITLVNM